MLNRPLVVGSGSFGSEPSPSDLFRDDWPNSRQCKNLRPAHPARKPRFSVWMRACAAVFGMRAASYLLPDARPGDPYGSFCLPGSPSWWVRSGPKGPRGNRSSATPTGFSTRMSGFPRPGSRRWHGRRTDTSGSALAAGWFGSTGSGSGSSRVRTRPRFGRTGSTRSSPITTAACGSARCPDLRCWKAAGSANPPSRRNSRPGRSPRSIRIGPARSGWRLIRAW